MMHVKVEERPISINELQQAFYSNTIQEAFGTGTAAVVAPIKTINIKGVDFHLSVYSHENISYKLKQQLELVRTGQAPDLFNWNYIV
jgi:branched-chain amino acid aminotransferase